MTYRLIVTCPNGDQFQSSAQPLPDREATGKSALQVLAAANIPFGRAGLALGRDIRDADLGATITHAPTGYTFRTEQF